MAADTRTGLPRASVERFFRQGVEMMESDATRERLKDPATSPKPGLTLIALQRANWEPMGVDPDFGCAALDQMEQLYPGDDELMQLKLQFVTTAQRIYLQAIEDRKPEVLEVKEKIPRATILEFFDACNTKMDLPGTQERLYTHLVSTKEMPNKIIIEMQRDMLETLGFEREHGCACLSSIGQDFPDDKELHAHFAGWQKKAQQTCMVVVQRHRQVGGEMPAGPFGDNPELQRLQQQAKDSLGQMTPAERGQLIERMQKKVQVFMNLPVEGRATYMRRLSEAEKLEFVKGQLLIVSMMQQQWMAQHGQQGGQHQAGCPQHQAAGGEQGADAAPAPVAAPPSQQQMMM